MKEKIYTIPLTDAFAEDSECPFCVLERKLEEEAVALSLIHISNKSGYKFFYSFKENLCAVEKNGKSGYIQGTTHFKTAMRR